MDRDTQINQKDNNTNNKVIDKIIIDNNFEVVIGLETHVELSTKTKMFCGCKLSFGKTPNTYTCPVCLGLPGSLPVINEKAVLFAVKIALALNCKINNYTLFHRKNYFYPDMPKNYQISQYDLPIGSDGYLDIDMQGYTRRVGILRVHMEEDTGKLIHTGSTGRISESFSSIVDFNRAGTPLIEIVTKPDIRSALEAKEYLISLRNLILYLDVSDCSMEQGSLRCDANISVKEAESDKLGVKTEIKNLNSFRFLQRALEYETQRQIEILKSGGKITQQTRHYDNITDTTMPLRTKEEAHDYRYFPDPDLVPIYVDDSIINKVKDEIPELPYQKYKRYLSEFNLPESDCKILTSDKNVANFFDKCIEIKKQNLKENQAQAETKDVQKKESKESINLNLSNLSNFAKNVSNWLIGDFASFLNKENISIKDSKVKPQNLCGLIELIENGIINKNTAKEVFEEMFFKGVSPDEVVKSKGLEQISDMTLIENIIQKVINENPGPVSEYKNGKEKAIGFLIGKIMVETKGKANPKIVSEMLKGKLAK